LLEKLEAALQTALEGTLGKLLPGKLHPLEIAPPLRDAMRDGKVVSTAGTFVPNEYVAFLNPADHGHLAPLLEDVQGQLAAYLAQYAASEGFSAGPTVSVLIASDPNVRPLRVRVDAKFSDRPTGCRLSVRAGVQQRESFEVERSAVIGRGSECDICLLNEAVSRRHAEIDWHYNGYVLRDLDSRNGTFVNGRQIVEQQLNEGDLIEVGLVQLHFSLRAD
jgi:hypothetical protein